MAHVSRPEHKKRFPLLITSRLCPGLRSLRHEREAECVRRALAAANRATATESGSVAGHGAAAANSGEAAHGAAAAKGATAASGATVAQAAGGAPFQVVHHSIQTNHLHLIVEADDRSSLTAGMRGLLVRIARALNRLWKRSGTVFADRFHEHELRKPREVRNALVYVLQNLRKHGIALSGPDPLSSGPEFDGWDAGSADREGARGSSRSGLLRFGADRAWPSGKATQAGKTQGPRASGGAPLFGSSVCRGAASLFRAARAEVPRAKTWLLGVGWRVHGLIDLRESPRGR